MNPLEKRRIYLNQKNQKKSSNWSKRKSPTSFNAVYITMSYQLSEISTSIASLATHVKNQENCLKQLLSQQMEDKSDSDKLFSSSEVKPEGTNLNKGSLVCGKIKSSKRGRNKWHVCTPPKSFDVCDMINFWLRPRSANVSTVANNSNETTLEADSHALKLFDSDCPVNVQGYDPTLGVKECHTISGTLSYTHPFTGIRYHLVIHQAVHMPELRHQLLCPMQCQANGFTISKCPRIYCN